MLGCCRHQLQSMPARRLRLPADRAQEVYQGREHSCSVQGLAPATELVFALKARCGRGARCRRAAAVLLLRCPITGTGAGLRDRQVARGPPPSSYDDAGFLWSEPILVTTPAGSRAGGRKAAAAASGAKG